jgi:hypothetical protein
MQCRRISLVPSSFVFRQLALRLFWCAERFHVAQIAPTDFQSEFANLSAIDSRIHHDRDRKNVLHDGLMSALDRFGARKPTCEQGYRRRRCWRIRRPCEKKAKSDSTNHAGNQDVPEASV